MRVNSVIFKFTSTDMSAIDKIKEVLDGEYLMLGPGTKIFLIGGQLAIQFFSKLSKPTPEQQAEFDRAFSAIKKIGDLLKVEKIEYPNDPSAERGIRR